MFIIYLQVFPNAFELWDRDCVAQSLFALLLQTQIVSRRCNCTYSKLANATWGHISKKAKFSNVSWCNCTYAKLTNATLRSFFFFC